MRFSFYLFCLSLVCISHAMDVYEKEQITSLAKTLTAKNPHLLISPRKVAFSLQQYDQPQLKVLELQLGIIKNRPQPTEPYTPVFFLVTHHADHNIWDTKPIPSARVSQDPYVRNLIYQTSTFSTVHAKKLERVISRLAPLQRSSLETDLEKLTKWRKNHARNQNLHYKKSPGSELYEQTVAHLIDLSIKDSIERCKHELEEVSERQNCCQRITRQLVAWWKQ